MQNPSKTRFLTIICIKYSVCTQSSRTRVRVKVRTAFTQLESQSSPTYHSTHVVTVNGYCVVHWLAHETALPLRRTQPFQFRCWRHLPKRERRVPFHVFQHRIILVRYGRYVFCVVYVILKCKKKIIVFDAHKLNTRRGAMGLFASCSRT